MSRCGSIPVSGEELVGKRVFWVKDTCIDKKGREKPSLNLYARGNNFEKTDKFPILYLWSEDEKHTTFGGKIFHKLTGEVLYQQVLTSNGCGTHWTKQAVILCLVCEGCEVVRHWTSNAGNHHEPVTTTL